MGKVVTPVVKRQAVRQIQEIFDLSACTVCVLTRVNDEALGINVIEVVCLLLAQKDQSMYWLDQQ